MKTKQIDAWRIDCHLRLDERNTPEEAHLPCKGTGEMSGKCKDCTDWGHMTLVVTAGRKK